MDNQDVINPQNSFNKLATLTLPKGTLTVLPPDRFLSSNGGVQLWRGLSYRRPTDRPRAQDNLLCCLPRVPISFLLSKVTQADADSTSLSDVCRTPKSWQRLILTRACRKLSALPSIRCLQFPCNGTFVAEQSTSPIHRRMPETPGRASGARSSAHDLGRGRIGESVAVPSSSARRVRICKSQAPW